MLYRKKMNRLINEVSVHNLATSDIDLDNISLSFYFIFYY